MSTRTHTFFPSCKCMLGYVQVCILWPSLSVGGDGSGPSCRALDQKFLKGFGTFFFICSLPLSLPPLSARAGQAGFA
eukprot:744898-Pelagomonas_calceolata.AAC.9